MSDVHSFERTFHVGGSAVELDSLRVEICDRLGRIAFELSAAGGEIAFDPATMEYSFSTDLARLPEGNAVVNWWAEKDGSPVGDDPDVELRVRPARHASYLGATVEMVLERLRGLDIGDFDPLYSGASDGGRDALLRVLGVAEGTVIAALPQHMWLLLTRRHEIVTLSAPEGVSRFTLHDEGGEIVSCSLFINDATDSLAPDRYTLDDRELRFTQPIAAGSKIVALLGYSGFAPSVLTELTVARAVFSAALSLCNPRTDTLAALNSERDRADHMLSDLRAGRLCPAEFRNMPLDSGTPSIPTTIVPGRIRDLGRR